MNLFYQQDIRPNASQINFDKEESRHINKVLRKKEGDLLHITNGNGQLFTTEILSSSPKNCIATVLNIELKKPLPYSLHMAVAPTKLNDRFEWFLEKATEMGITEITPIICDHSERKVIKKERYEKIIVSAMKQSLSCYLPKLNDAIPFSKFLELPHSENFKGIAHCDDDVSKVHLKNVVNPGSSYLILIGPEGDFSKTEVKNASKLGFKAISLGDRRLRTETAAIAVTGIIAFSFDSLAVI
ncbi:MAG: 16S rRNA (uracil1498-N3)-methyltransferase [Saprospiraceae bacterium]